MFWLSPATIAVILLQLASEVTALQSTNARALLTRRSRRRCVRTIRDLIGSPPRPTTVEPTNPPSETTAIKLPEPQPVADVKPSPSADTPKEPSATGAISDPQYQRLVEILPSVLRNAIDISHKSWELGTITETLLELDNPELTPFGWNGDLTPSSKPVEFLRITANMLNNYNWDGRPEAHTDDNLNNYLSPETSKTPIQPRDLVNGDGALGDPASMGMAAWVLAHNTDIAGDVGAYAYLQSRDAYAWAVGNQYAYLQQGPRQDGIISHRASNWQLWSDQGYMIPPFIAYLGLTTKDQGKLQEALDQWTGVPNSLMDWGSNLYRHIWPSAEIGEDGGLWLTGNAWMLMGLMRVIASIRASGFSIDTSAAEESAAKTFQALFDRADDSGLMANYLNEQWGGRESAGSAGVVAAYYRFLKLNPGLADPLKAKAEKAFGAVVNKLDWDGWLQDVVDPSGNNGFQISAGIRSPEGQSFTVLMCAARRDAGQ